MGLFGSNKKNRFVEDVPGETAEDRLHYYVQQANEPPPGEKRRGRKDGKREKAHPPALVKGRREDDDLGDIEPALASEPAPGRGKLIDEKYQPIARAPKRDQATIHELELRDPGDDHPHPRTMMDKMFGLSWGGWLQLLLITIVVGVVIESSGLNPFDRTFDPANVLSALWDGAVHTVSWAFGNGWRPFLIGLAIVAPLWVIWRLLTIPFRH
jgi:hypothetical protein